MDWIRDWLNHKNTGRQTHFYTSVNLKMFTNVNPYSNIQEESWLANDSKKPVGGDMSLKSISANMLKKKKKMAEDVSGNNHAQQMLGLYLFKVAKTLCK